MPIRQLIAIVLIVAGTAGLIYGGFSFTKETHTAEIGSLSLAVDEQQQVRVPLWAGLGAVLAGVVLLLMREKS